MQTVCVLTNDICLNTSDEEEGYTHIYKEEGHFPSFMKVIKSRWLGFFEVSDPFSRYLEKINETFSERNEAEMEPDRTWSVDIRNISLGLPSPARNKKRDKFRNITSHHYHLIG